MVNHISYYASVTKAICVHCRRCRLTESEANNAEKLELVSIYNKLIPSLRKNLITTAKLIETSQDAILRKNIEWEEN